MIDSGFPIILKGSIPSKKNAWRRGASGGVYIDRDLKDILENLEHELWLQKRQAKLENPLQGNIRVKATLYVLPGRHVDDDNAYTTFQDLLQKAEIIKNDNMVYDHHVRRIVVKENPRIEAVIYSDKKVLE